MRLPCTEGVAFAYQIAASDSPTGFGATGLPQGLKLDPTNGLIAGTPVHVGTNTVTLTARNGWGTGSNTLTLNILYPAITTLTITDVTYDYASDSLPPNSPYLVDFEFSLRDNPDGDLSYAVVRPLSQLSVVCREDTRGISPTETAFILDRGNRKTVKSFLVLDYTASMQWGSPDSDGIRVSDAIDAMQTSAKSLINVLSADAQFGIYEFHADYVDPIRVKRFTSDKAALGESIDGILPTIVQGSYAGTRCWDAIFAALNEFGPANRDEQRYLMVMTDGNDESSWSSTNGVVNAMVALANSKGVKLNCVAFGASINTEVLWQLSSQTGGRYYVAATAGDLPAQFEQMGKDIDGQYVLRWATFKRNSTPFRPSFDVTVDAHTASYNSDMSIASVLPDYVPSQNAGNVLAGGLRLVASADEGPQTVTLRATYVPRYVRKVRFHYRANYPCATSLRSTGPGEILNAYSMTETNDGEGGNWIEITSPEPTNSATSIPYGVMGNLVTFSFRDLPSGQQAFGLFVVDNSIYPAMPPSGQSFVIENTNEFITVYPVTPHGTPVPWLLTNGFTGDMTAAELSDPDHDGALTWQEYLAGTNPRDPASKLVIRNPGTSVLNQPFEITFPTVSGRTYRVDTATSLGNWQPLQDGIAGSGSDVTVRDLFPLNGTAAMFYRIVVY